MQGLVAARGKAGAGWRQRCQDHLAAAAALATAADTGEGGGGGPQLAPLVALHGRRMKWLAKAAAARRRRRQQQETAEASGEDDEEEAQVEASVREAEAAEVLEVCARLVLGKVVMVCGSPVALLQLQLRGVSALAHADASAPESPSYSRTRTECNCRYCFSDMLARRLHAQSTAGAEGGGDADGDGCDDLHVPLPALLAAVGAQPGKPAAQEELEVRGRVQQHQNLAEYPRGHGVGLARILVMSHSSARVCDQNHMPRSRLLHRPPGWRTRTHKSIDIFPLRHRCSQ